MKKRNSKKCDSFDFIKMSPKKSNPNNSICLRDQDYTCFTPHILAYSKDRQRVELPKIHILHVTKHKKTEKTVDMEYSQMESKLLLLGYQFRNDNQLSRQELEGRKDKELSRRKNILSKEAIVSRKQFVASILNCFYLDEVLLERRKILAYVQQGNNSRMVKQMLRRRHQIEFVADKKQANLVWTRFCDYQSSKLLSKLREEQAPSRCSKEEARELPEHSTKLLYQIASYTHSTLQHHSQPLAATNKNMMSLNLSKDLAQEGRNLSKIFISDLRMHNHFTSHYEISDKKSLFANLNKYCGKHNMKIFDMVPVTFEIGENVGELPVDIQEGFWFIKPGEDTNRGNGISIASGRLRIREQIQRLLKIGKTAIVQKYVEPLLYKNRKFDMRCYTLVLAYRGELKAYWYKQGYVRTCSKEFNYDVTDVLAHLTNDAVQKKSPLYGKYQQSNKLSFGDLETYLRGKDIAFRQIVSEMKNLVVHSLKAVEHCLKGDKNQFNFQIFGYDFLIDKESKVWLIEVNTNPCLEFTGSLTARVIGHMLDNSLKVALDPLLSSDHGPREDYSRISQDNKYQCII